MTKQYRSPVMASIHETAEGLHAAGIMDKQTMRKFDDACLTPVRPLTPEEIRACANAKAQVRPCSLAISTSPRASSANGNGAKSIRKERRSNSYPSSPSTASAPSHNSALSIASQSTIEGYVLHSFSASLETPMRIQRDLSRSRTTTDNPA